MASSSLNAANCTAAPDCEALNRDDCGANGLREENTCGECISGTVGVLGPHNSPCVDEAALDPSCSDGSEVSFDASRVFLGLLSVDVGQGGF